MTGPGFIKSIAMRSPCVIVGPSRRGAAETAGPAAPFMAMGSAGGSFGGCGRGGRDAGPSAGLRFAVTGSSSVIVGAGRRGGRGTGPSPGLLGAMGSPAIIVGLRRRGDAEGPSACLLSITTPSPDDGLVRGRREASAPNDRSPLLREGAFNPNCVS